MLKDFMYSTSMFHVISLALVCSVSMLLIVTTLDHVTALPFNSTCLTHFIRIPTTPHSLSLLTVGSLSTLSALYVIGPQ